MSSYIVSSLTSETGDIVLSQDDFNTKFNKSISEEFKDELDILKKIGMLVIQNKKIILFPRNDYEKAFATMLFGT
ncbi:MAG: hypothetical protein GQ477_01800 [Nanohaloarchaea archaeon]|nr:hypothetical protein [Candidatus Nanohaloarchaea archaeon]